MSRASPFIPTQRQRQRRSMFLVTYLSVSSLYAVFAQEQPDCTKEVYRFNFSASCLLSRAVDNKKLNLCEYQKSLPPGATGPCSGGERIACVHENNDNDAYRESFKNCRAYKKANGITERPHIQPKQEEESFPLKYIIGIGIASIGILVLIIVIIGISCHIKHKRRLLNLQHKLREDRSNDKRRMKHGKKKSSQNRLKKFRDLEKTGSKPAVRPPQSQPPTTQPPSQAIERSEQISAPPMDAALTPTDQLQSESASLQITNSNDIMGLRLDSDREVERRKSDDDSDRVPEKRRIEVISGGSPLEADRRSADISEDFDGIDRKPKFDPRLEAINGKASD